MSRKPKDRVEVLEEQVRKLQQQIREKDKTIKQLKSQVKTTRAAWHTTEVYLKEVTNGKPLSEVLKTVGNGEPLSKDDEPCPKCNSRDFTKILFTGFYLTICDCCDYRVRVDEEREIEKG